MIESDYYDPADDFRNPNGFSNPTAADPVADLLTPLDPATDLAVPHELAPLTSSDLDPVVGLTDPTAPGFIEAALPGTELPWEAAAPPGLLDPTDAGAFAHLNHQPDGLTFGAWCGCSQCHCASFSGRGDICDNCHHSRSSHYY